MFGYMSFMKKNKELIITHSQSFRALCELEMTKAHRLYLNLGLGSEPSFYSKVGELV
ncbi:hypothetical protein Marme_3228 [Marinomonas mediterranea MMB-1]|uniref:Uncharacterized protein n=1 Tax=Marinomonas mediterranea (strain ATCC 700492 / JCM 21426 / NBRC 103028 / MMB-1) TaxID=717774 RepID=F2K3K5_MARM1|nr:hypothetical protein Marme_3228 [Marinomonas mediterranea MMB-1]